MSEIVARTIADEDTSRWLNAMTGGDADETFGSRIWRERRYWKRPWFWVLLWRIDYLAARDHGEEPGNAGGRP